MVKTNRDNLLEISVIGEIIHPAIDSRYGNSWDGETSAGHGPGVNPIFSTEDGRIDVEIVEKANIAEYFGLK